MQNLLIGKSGEYRVLSELLLRGYNPAIMAVDNGVDIVLDNKRTIQVKTVSKPVRKGFYTISVRKDSKSKYEKYCNNWKLLNKEEVM